MATDDITKYFECECSCSIIAVSKWVDDPEITISMYSMGEGHRPNWRFRLGHIWNIIRRGNPYSDSIVLSGDEAGRLAELLAKIGNEEKT